MSSSEQFLSPSEAVGKLGVSTKALRLYEQRGLIVPTRTAAGWRTYGPGEMVQATEIVALRALGLSLTQVALVLKGDPRFLEPALAAHQTSLQGQIRQLTHTVEKVQTLRADIAQGQSPDVGELARMHPAIDISVSFDLPWPWGGEKLELHDVRSLNYIIGPLFSGKTRLAQMIAETLPDAVFLGLERLHDDGTEVLGRLDENPDLKSRVDAAMDWLTGEGATDCPALTVLIAEIEHKNSSILVIDMVESGLDQATQEALTTYLRRRGPDAQPIFVLTRSCAILDLTLVGENESIILCPANHSTPTQVAPYQGAPGYEAVATCLASPEVRARTEGVIAYRPQVA